MSHDSRRALERIQVAVGAQGCTMVEVVLTPYLYVNFHDLSIHRDRSQKYHILRFKLLRSELNSLETF